MKKLHIDNRTDLPLKTIVDILERWEASSYDETNYVGKWWGLNFEIRDERFQMEILIKKTCLVVLVIKTV